MNALLIIGGIGLVAAAILSVAAKLLAVEVDPKEAAVAEALPGANCGGCGFAGCSAYATELVTNPDAEFCCPVANEKDLEVLSAILERPLGGGAPLVAFVRCRGSIENAESKYQYLGVTDCRAAQLVAGGPKDCSFGCLGLGSCVTVCPFDAMYMGDDGLPHIIDAKCVACGKCVAACPRNIIELIPEGAQEVVGCISEDAGKFVRQYCSVGCISCKKCVKVCPVDAITVAGKTSPAVIDQSLCTKCGECVSACPTSAIVDKLSEVPR